MSYYPGGNLLSILAFFIWVPIALYGMRRWSPAKATAVLLFGGLLLLPEAVFFKPPGLPDFTKLEIIPIWILIGAAIFHRERLKSVPTSLWFRVCVALLIAGLIFTVFLNTDAFRVGSRFVPGHVPYDAVHFILEALLHVVLPFYLGAAMFRGSKDLRVLLTTIVVAALLYSPLQFIELILSPQLHRWVYGFHQHAFEQTIRAEGYRPMVFMAHGLALALFVAQAVVAAAALKKARVRVRGFPAVWAMWYLWGVLLLSKSVASFLYSLIAAPLVLFASPRIQAFAAAALMAALFVYPAARATGLVPVEGIRTFSEAQYGKERATSLMFRFDNEAKMLERATQRPWFGWGTYCRACLFDPWSGDQTSVRDGAWIIQLGNYGIVGFVGKFSLLLFPLLAFIRRMKYIPRVSDQRLLAGLGLMVGFAAFDLIPNGDFTRMAFFLSGALWGCLNGILQEATVMRNKRRLARIATLKEARSAAPAPLAGMAALSALLLAVPVAAAAPDATGGGFTGAGIEGAYFANPDLDGTPSFIRRDVRIDFDWKDARPVGGSTAEPYRSFPRDKFSVRWRGRIIPRFSEAYIFLGQADDGVRVRVRAPGQSTWRTVVERWYEAGDFKSLPFMMRANEAYDIQVEYREIEGSARCRLMWESENTPAEVVDPLRQQAINLSRYVWADYIWADLMKSVRYGEKAQETDARGWPTTTGIELVIGERYYGSDPEMSGAYLFRFEGQAEVRQECCGQPVFQANGRRFQWNLPRGVGYEASTNSTTTLMTLSGSRTMLTFNDAQRAPGGGGAGVAQIQLMRPLAQGSSKHHRADEIVYRPFKQVAEEHFTVLRFVASADHVGESWSQRTLPDHAFFYGDTGQPNWEYAIMLANETGRDLYITIPIESNEGYLEKLALLMRHGSDGHEPYKKPTPDPTYPPLNPNLRLYVEMDNEIWNWAFRTTQDAQRLTEAEHDRGSATWKVIDYDGQAGDADGIQALRRWHAVRTVQTSNAFRQVWGDDAMGSRIRTLMEYQYDNYQDTALSSLDFIDGYYNNRNGTNVSDPHPVRHYIWGAGGAAYYGLENSTGQQTHTRLQDASFEDTPIEAKTLRLRPSGTAWTFKGKSGLLRPEGEKTIEGLDNLPTVTAGEQVAFLLGDGSISQEVQFAEPGTYSIAFNAAGSGDGWPGYQHFDILLDGRKVSPREQVDPRVSPDVALLGGWARDINSLSEEWGSAVFHVDAPGLRTLSFVSRGEAVDYLLIDNVRIASADAIMTSEFDRGEALGQEAGPDLAQQLNNQAKYARAFGLQVVAYESGWSLGGDFHQVPLQNWCKLEDPRATGINDSAIQFWDQSGSFLPVWGVYKYWPSHDFAGAANYPIMRSFRGAAQRLPAEPTYGRPIPTSLQLGDTDWSHRSEGSQSWWRRHIPCLNEPTDQWHAWMLIAPSTGTYSFRVHGRGTGRLIVEVDGEPVGELSSLKEAGGAPLTARLVKGAHAVRVLMVGGELELDQISVGMGQDGS